jgi:hypothetical protein
MNQQEAQRAGAVSWLRAGRTVKEIMSSGNFSKNTVVEKEIWPPSSHDCNPFDYFVWGVSELRVRAKPHNKTKNMILKIKGVMVSLARSIVAETCKRFRSQIEAVVTADGIFID